MSVFQLILSNPSLSDLAKRYPHLRRFLHLGFKTDIRFHADNVVGIVNQFQTLRVNLLNGDVEAVA